ncbi:MAG TPA: hypothetical protein VD995_02990 [Azospirillum sp.]|nr:hypothetical protein [Azospirillum sp.]
MTAHANTDEPTEHACGTCTLCCKLMRVPELDKPAARWCDHCAPDAGCRVYAGRPESCRGFRCLWLMDRRFPDALRPDRCHALVATNGAADDFVVHVDPAHPEAADAPAVRSLVAALCASGRRVYRLCGDSTVLMETTD